MTRQRYSIRESWNRLLRLWKGETSNEQPGTVTGEILSENQAVSDFTELFAGSLPNETLTLPTSVYNAIQTSGFATGTVSGYAVDIVSGTASLLSAVETLSLQAGLDVSVTGTTAYVGVEYDGGWNDTGVDVSFGSADDPTYVGTIASNVTGTYSAGMRFRCSQATGGVKYFIITEVSYSDPNTSLTLYGGTDYNLENEAISSPSYSTEKSPFGFPLNPEKWTVEVTDTSLQTQATPSVSTWYNLGSITISIPIGIWNVQYRANPQIDDASAIDPDAYITLSTANNSEVDKDFSYRTSVSAGSFGFNVPVFTEKILDLSVKDSYFLNLKTETVGLDNLRLRGDLSTTIIRAVSVYL